MPSVVTADHLAKAQLFKRVYSRYQQNRDLISVGAYSPGHDPMLDKAVQLYPQLEKFLQQRIDERASIDASLQALVAALRS